MAWTLRFGQTCCEPHPGSRGAPQSHAEHDHISSHPRACPPVSLASRHQGPADRHRRQGVLRPWGAGGRHHGDTPTLGDHHPRRTEDQPSLVTDTLKRRQHRQRTGTRGSRGRTAPRQAAGLGAGGHSAQGRSATAERPPCARRGHEANDRALPLRSPETPGEAKAGTASPSRRTWTIGQVGGEGNGVGETRHTAPRTRAHTGPRAHGTHGTGDTGRSLAGALGWSRARGVGWAGNATSSSDSGSRPGPGVPHRGAQRPRGDEEGLRLGARAHSHSHSHTLTHSHVRAQPPAAGTAHHGNRVAAAQPRRPLKAPEASCARRGRADKGAAGAGLAGGPPCRRASTGPPRPPASPGPPRRPPQPAWLHVAQFPTDAPAALTGGSPAGPTEKRIS